MTWPFGGLPLGGVFLGQADGPVLGVARLGGPLGLTAAVYLGGVGVGALAEACPCRAGRRPGPDVRRADPGAGTRDRPARDRCRLAPGRRPGARPPGGDAVAGLGTLAWSGRSPSWAWWRWPSPPITRPTAGRPSAR